LLWNDFENDTYVGDNSIHEYIYELSYLGIFLWFAVIEQFNFIPEEVSLISVGYITVYTSLDPFFSGIVSLAGLLCTDLFLFFIALRGNKLSVKLINKTDAKLIGKIKGHLNNHAGKAIFIMALLPKVRFISPIIAGVSNVSWKVFLLFNSIATTLYVSFYILIGILFQREIHRVLEKLEIWQHAIFIGFIAISGFFFLWGIRKLIAK
jgi:membrane protein DedA with SNARE-associated domain